MNVIKKIGLVLFGLGVLLLIGFGLYSAGIDPETPNVIKIGLTALVVGLIVLIFVLVIERANEKNKQEEEQYDSEHNL